MDNHQENEPKRRSSNSLGSQGSIKDMGLRYKINLPKDSECESLEMKPLVTNIVHKPSMKEDKDFEELSFEGKEEKIYLDGALKICSNSLESKFNFRGRIARASDFLAITSYLISVENMVCENPVSLS